jgi:hypothetical protein
LLPLALVVEELFPSAFESKDLLTFEFFNCIPFLLAAAKLGRLFRSEDLVRRSLVSGFSFYLPVKFALKLRALTSKL